MNDGVLYHGSNDGEITHFSPRQNQSSTEFASKKAVFATDLLPLAALYSVILRTGLNSRVNGAFYEGERLLYFYAISHVQPIDQVLIPGFLYILDRSEFSVDPGDPHHWACEHEVKPLQRISISPEDIPFCREIRTHDQKALLLRIESQGFDGFPFYDDPEVYPSNTTTAQQGTQPDAFGAG